MQIELRLTIEPNFPIRSYDPGEDDVRSILMDVCRAIKVKSEFLVAGFGQERWPVDVETDLPVFLEQLPYALRAVQQGTFAEIDFYEQGIERSIAMKPAGDKYVLTCTSRTRWNPSPATEEIPSESLERMLLAVKDAFMISLTEMAPSLARHPWTCQWLEGLENE